MWLFHVSGVVRNAGSCQKDGNVPFPNDKKWLLFPEALLAVTPGGLPELSSVSARLMPSRSAFSGHLCLVRADLLPPGLGAAAAFWNALPQTCALLALSLASVSIHMSLHHEALPCPRDLKCQTAFRASFFLPDSRIW